MDKSDLDPDQSRQTFPLRKNQRYFLLTDEKGSSSSKSSIRKDIKSKLNEIGPRLQDLIDDIVLLDESGYIEEEQEKVWEQLIDIDSRESWIEETVVLSDQIRNHNSHLRRLESEQHSDLNITTSGV